MGPEALTVVVCAGRSAVTVWESNPETYSMYLCAHWAVNAFRWKKELKHGKHLHMQHTGLQT